MLASPTAQFSSLSLHDALPICNALEVREAVEVLDGGGPPDAVELTVALAEQMLAAADATVSSTTDRKSTRLNSSHVAISYAVCCMKKKRKTDLFTGLQSWWSQD